MVTVAKREQLRRQNPQKAQISGPPPPTAAPFPPLFAANAELVKANSVKSVAPKIVSVARKKSHRQMLADVAIARKKEALKEKAHPFIPFFLKDPWVYVSNLDPDLTEPRLHAHFAVCGDVEHVTIRHCGSLIPASPETPSYRYAIVKFRTYIAARAALDLNKSKVKGSKKPLAVEPNIAQLPEVPQIPDMDLDALRRKSSQRRRCKISMENQPTASGAARYATANSPLVLAKTKVWKPTPEAERQTRRTKGKSFIVSGVSFQMTLA
ncbi:hypothetical protein DFH09DRAFT_1310519 [Mycena vulgaris]|nr:hypothetical protein DFH09DRAFT_1310519 [Mycena vulgaris]